MSKPQKNALRRYADGGPVSPWDNGWQQVQTGSMAGPISAADTTSGMQDQAAVYDPSALFGADTWRQLGYTGNLNQTETGSGDMIGATQNREFGDWYANQGLQLGQQRAGTQGSNALTRGGLYDYQLFNPQGESVGQSARLGDNNASALRGIAMVGATALGAGAYGAASGGAASGAAGGSGVVSGGSGLSAGTGGSGLVAGTGGSGLAVGSGGAIGSVGAGTGAGSAAGAGMSYLDWAQLGTQVLGSAISSNQAGQAARGQQDAANAAAAEQRRQFDLTRADNAPYQQAGYAGLAQQQQLANQYMGGPSNLDVQNEPGYQFGMDQGTRAVQNSAAARGGLFSGAAGRAVGRYATDYAASKYNDAWNRLNTSQNQDFNRFGVLANTGQTANAQVQGSGQNAANQLGNIYGTNANAQGAAGIAQGNIWQNQLNQFGSQMNQRRGPNSTNMSNFGTGSAYGNQDLGQYLADGGPVRKQRPGEPVIGTRGPVRGGGGGGMSQEAILRALQTQPVAQPKQGMGSLPADPLRQPGLVRDLQLEAVEKRLAYGGPARKNYMGGGSVSGPGGPRDDMIPARLSDGEHVFDTRSVNALGGGSNDIGQQRLNALRELLQAMG